MNHKSMIALLHFAYGLNRHAANDDMSRASLAAIKASSPEELSPMLNEILGEEKLEELAVALIKHKLPKWSQ